MLETIHTQIENIHVGKRHRHDLGDLTALADSIRNLGLLQPIGIDANHNLIFGQRRLEACRSLGLSHIPARIVDAPAILAERDENEVRKDFTPSERVAIGQAVEEFLGERRGRPSKTISEIVENFPQFPPSQKTRDIAAQSAGFGNGKTYQQAKSVIEHGTPELVEAMDRGNISISAAATIAKLPEEEQQAVVAGGGIKAVLGGYSGNNEWYTPARWIEMARKTLGTIDVDPASSAMAQRTVNAAEWYDQERDGLKYNWPGNVWLNPPYARGLIEAFVDRLVTQFQSGITKQAVVLVDNRTDTKWFHALCNVATAVAFTRGRVNFYNESIDSSSPANGSVFVYLGQDWASFKRAFAEDCLILANPK